MTAGDPTAQPARSVLLCYDGSEHAEHVFRCARALLRPRVATVLHTRGRGGSDGVAQSGARLARQSDFNPVSVIELNRPPTAKALLTKAHRLDVAVIVVGSHGRPAPPSSPRGNVALVRRTDIPVLLVRSQAVSGASEHGGPLLVCYDGSAEAHGAIDAAANLLSDRDGIVVSFLEPVDDVALLQKTLPWPPPADMERHLARLDHDEAEFLAQRAAAGAAVATSVGIAARPLPVEGPGSAWSRLLDAAGTAAASCIRQDIVQPRPGFTAARRSNSCSTPNAPSSSCRARPGTVLFVIAAG